MKRNRAAIALNTRKPEPAGGGSILRHRAIEASLAFVVEQARMRGRVPSRDVLLKELIEMGLDLFLRGMVQHFQRPKATKV